MGRSGGRRGGRAGGRTSREEGAGAGKAERQKSYRGLLEALRVNKPEQQSQMGMGVLGRYPT